MCQISFLTRIAVSLCAGGRRTEKTVINRFVPTVLPLKSKTIAAMIAPLFLSACGSMSFGETFFDTVGVFFEANEIKHCYEGGGSRETCEGGGW